MGPMTDAGYRSFPWGYGATPIEAYTAWLKLQKRWKKLQKRAAPPEVLIPDAPQNSPLRAPSDAPTMGDEHAANLGAV